MGNFESEKNFDTLGVHSWYSFREEKLLRVKTKYAGIDCSKSVGLHLRLGDKQKESYTKSIYFIPKVQYYINALEFIKNYENILIFSDDIPAAQEYFNTIKYSGIIYMQDNADWEDLYLMTQCRDFICGASTLSWWGAWLGKNQNKTVIFPQEGIFRPGSGFINSDFVADGWMTLTSLRPIKDHYILAGFPLYGINRRLKNKVGRWLKKYFPRFFYFLLHYFG